MIQQTTNQTIGVFDYKLNKWRDLESLTKEELIEHIKETYADIQSQRNKYQIHESTEPWKTISDLIHETYALKQERDRLWAIFEGKK